MDEATFPISKKVARRLRELAGWLGSSSEAALEQAINELYERKFWEMANAGYAALRADPQAWAELEAERRLWDATLMDGLDPTERWTEDGDVLPPPSEERAS